MNRARVIRLALLGAIVVALVIVRYTTSIGTSLTTQQVRDLVQHAGGAGVALFLVAFAVGELLHVPGLVFVAAAVLVWGRVGGGAIAYLGALVSISFSFFIVRFIGGQPLAEIKRRWVRTILAQLERRPIRTVALLRLILWMAPAVNYALALSSIRYRDYAIGSAIGLAIPVAAASAFLELLLR
jgi:uncharacterized membrane protein YdjX (TVP38/TMEM64 family)